MRLAVASKAVDTLRDVELVHTSSEGDAALAAFEIRTWRDARTQWIVSCGRAELSVNVASLPSLAAE